MKSKRMEIPSDEDADNITPRAYSEEELNAAQDLHPEMTQEEVKAFLEEEDEGDDTLSELYYNRRAA